ncbi:MAG TPA: TatD family hydrolase [Saprospiraceae bacterium]|nr:TatD family hydrolase [Saprospiraceae bacterium]HMQ85403.1 TatD family hydrolase [Saprospiraceae bacterium]
MLLIDTHTHLYLPDFEQDRAAMINRAVEAGVGRFYLPNIDSGSIAEMLQLESLFPGRCYPMMGLHPCSVKENYEEELAIVRTWLDARPFCAIGEIGIDLYWDKTFLSFQQEAFFRQAKWAKELGIPIVIHSRDATELVIELLEQIPVAARPKGVFHCFSGTEAQAHQVIELGFYLGIGGVLTFKKAGLDQVVRAISLDWLVLETDSPYLAPVPYRGKRNESAYVRLVAQKLAELKEIPLEAVAAQTSANAIKLFHPVHP